MKTKLFITALFITASFLAAKAQYTKLLDFNGSGNGGTPLGTPVTDGTFLYGTTSYGGTYGVGTIFKIKPDGTAYARLYAFDSINGSNPRGSLLYDGTFLYGMTETGGSGLCNESFQNPGCGVIYKIRPDGTGFTKLFDFGGVISGRYPHLSSLIAVDSFLYGVTEYGGIYTWGVIFKIRKDGTDFTKLFDFSGSQDGRRPKGSLIVIDSFLYGMASGGGSDEFGAIFKIKPDGTGYTNIFDFDYLSGQAPTGSLIFDGTFLYGMARGGGTSDMGNIFKIKPDGTAFSRLFDFAGINGNDPYGALLFDGTFMYGMTANGGSTLCQNGCGVIFKIKPDGTEYSKLMDFTITNGRSPTSSFMSDGIFLYGVTGTGGTYNDGVLFKYCPPRTFVQSPTVCAGESVTIGSSTYDTTGTYADVLTAVNGCDSIVTTNLTVLAAIAFAQSPSICVGDSITVGNNTYTTSGTYTDVFTAANGCDSTVTTNLTVLSIINNFTITPPTCSNNNGSVTAVAWGGIAPYTFRWNNGNTTSTVTGLTGQPADTLIITITDLKGCILTDTAIVSCVTGIADNDGIIGFKIHSNPTSGMFIIEMETQNANGEVEIYNVMGEKVYETTISEPSSTISLDVPDGIYFIHILTEQGTASKKIVVSH